MPSIMLAALIAMLLPSSFLIEENQDEHTIKALFVYNFTKHIEWPQGKISDHFVIGFTGNTPVYDRLNEIMKNRKIKNLSVEIRKISKSDKIKSCDILYITNGEKVFLKANELTDSYGVLVITEEKTINTQISCINIIERNERMKFELNEAIIKNNGFKISNQLYELAAISH